MPLGCCTNLPSRCSNAAGKTLIEMNQPGARCPECGASLAPFKAPGRGNALVVVAGVVLVLLVLAVAGYVFFKPRNSATVVPAGGGPASAPVATVSTNAPMMTLSGSNTIGAKLAPRLIEAWLQSLGAGQTRIEELPTKDETAVRGVLAGQPVWVWVKAHGSGDAFKDLGAAKADIGMASRKIKPEEVAQLTALGNMTSRASEHVLALDGVAVIVSPSNPLESLKKEQIGQIFTGAITDWGQVGGAPGRIKIYARNDNSGTFDTFKSLAMRGAPLLAEARRYEDSRLLEQAVASDPQGVGFVGLPFVKTAKPLSVADGTSLPLAATAFTVRREDYALSRRLYFYVAANTKHPHVRDFINFSLSPAGQQVVHGVGFVDLDLNRPATPTPVASLPDKAHCRLSEAWRGNREEYCQLRAAARVLETSFRFRTGSYDLDNRAFRDLRRVLEWLEQNPGKQVVLVGFADAQGAYAANVALSDKRASTVADALKTLGVPGTGIAMQGFGPELPVADNETEEGREKNRRVEIFVR